MQASSEHFTLYVDGACRGNPGLGGWGALILHKNGQKQEFYGGELNTTNNRMELTAAIEGIKACPLNAKLTIYTDSVYVQKGITEWITGWKAKNWKNVKNPDLWKTLDQVNQQYQIEWKWIKGHAGHEGNERADQLANIGADEVNQKKRDISSTALRSGTSSTLASTSPSASAAPTSPLGDWLLDDPFGLDDHDPEYDEVLEDTTLNAEKLTQNESDAMSSSEHTHIRITQASSAQQGQRQLILDTETTGFYYQDGDRIIEVGAIEMINRRLTGSSIHIYINPKKPVGESENIHGLSDEFLSDKPLFQDISQTLYDYLKGAEIIAHNANFDMNFLNAEFERVGLGKLSDVCAVMDTLALAKRKHPGQKNSLDALVRRYEVPARDRTFHGALLDAEILADVYLAMTGGQVSLDIDSQQHASQDQAHSSLNSALSALELPVILPHADELDAHTQWLEQFEQDNQQPALFAQLKFS